jgi:hypothetical protein
VLCTVVAACTYRSFVGVCPAFLTGEADTALVRCLMEVPSAPSATKDTIGCTRIRVLEDQAFETRWVQGLGIAIDLIHLNFIFAEFLQVKSI